MTIIALINESTVLTDAQVAAAAPAFHKQISRDFANWWPQGRGAGLTFYPKGATPPPGAWLAHLLDDSTQAGALGYHDVTSGDQPEALIFVKSDIESGSSWTVTVSHELLEMLVDPLASISVLSADGSKFYAFEVCDAPEADGLGYQIDGVLVSDFVLPAWFQSDRKSGSARFDFCNVLTGPVPNMAAGGYVGYLDLGNLQAGWQQMTMQRAPARQSQRFQRRAARKLKIRPTQFGPVGIRAQARIR